MWKMILERIKYWMQLFLLPIYWLSFLIPRSKKIWLFGSTFGRRFADNPKYFYLYLNEHRELGIRPIWITRDKEIHQFLLKHGFETYYVRSLRGIWYCLRSKVYIFDNYSKDISHWLSAGAVKINLWHGSGNKKTNYDNIFDKVRHPKNLWERWKTFPRRLSDEKPHHYTLATSEAMGLITQSAFHTTKEHVIIDGYPRNDAMLNPEFPNLLNEKEQKNLDDIREWKKEGYIIDLYMTTFRDSEADFFKVMNLEKFNEYLQFNGIIFVVKLHPKSKLQKQFLKIEYSNIKVIDANIDPYTFVGEVDILTSDYSSIYTDFLLLDRPVVAFHFDYDKYSTETRDSYISFEEYMPEKKAISMEELMSLTLEVLKQDPQKEARKTSKARMFQYDDDKSTQRLVQKVKRIVGLKE